MFLVSVIPTSQISFTYPYISIDSQFAESSLFNTILAQKPMVLKTLYFILFYFFLEILIFRYISTIFKSLIIFLSQIKDPPSTIILQHINVYYIRFVNPILFIHSLVKLQRTCNIA